MTQPLSPPPPPSDDPRDLEPAFEIPPPRAQGVLPFHKREIEASNPWLLFTAIGVMALGVFLDWAWIGLSGTLVTLLLSLKIMYPSIRGWLTAFLTEQERKYILGAIAFVLSFFSFLKFLGVYRLVGQWLNQIKWDEFGSWADWFGALGQILIAVLAVYVAWEQYVISRDLTIQQNRITQQQTIDTYFQGISDLALNEEGLLEDWPQERSIAEGRTAAILSSVDAGGKAKILRFLSQSLLLTPLKRDTHLGRPLLDGHGGYLEDRDRGVRVIDLGMMLAVTDLRGHNLRGVDLSEANMVRSDLRQCDLSRANLSRTVLYEAELSGADFQKTRLFYGPVETASPRSRRHRPNYQTGEYTGAVVENANFQGVQRLSEEQRYYCCSWCGEAMRNNIPGGCEGIPNRLGR